jgi:O-antigen/teichoic acid export membrane protein
MAALAYLGLLGAVWAVPGFRDVAPLVAIFGLSLPAVAFSAEWVPQALHRTGITALANMGLQLFYLTFLGLGLLMGMPLLGVAVARVTADALVALGFRFWAWRRPRPDPEAAPDPAAPSCAPGRVARAAAPICATQIVRTLALTSDMLLLGLMVPADSLGHYAAASRLFYVMMSLATAYFIIVLPRIAAAAANPPPALRTELRESLRRTVPLALAGTLLLAPLSPVILSTMFGAEFVHAAPALAILGAATAASLIGRHYRQVLLARSRQVDDLRLSLAGSAVHVTAKLALIPFLGITGAALGTFLGETFILLVQRRATRNELDR